MARGNGCKAAESATLPELTKDLAVTQVLDGRGSLGQVDRRPGGSDRPKRSGVAANLSSPSGYADDRLLRWIRREAHT